MLTNAFLWCIVNGIPLSGISGIFDGDIMKLPESYNFFGYCPHSARYGGVILRGRDVLPGGVRVTKWVN